MRRLPKVVDDANGRQTLHRVTDVVEIFCSLVREMMEHVDRLKSCLASLFVPEDEINPLVQILADIRALEGFTMLGDKNLRIAPCPWRQLDLINGLARNLSSS